MSSLSCFPIAVPREMIAASPFTYRNCGSVRSGTCASWYSLHTQIKTNTDSVIQISDLQPMAIPSKSVLHEATPLRCGVHGALRILQYILSFLKLHKQCEIDVKYAQIGREYWVVVGFRLAASSMIWRLKMRTFENTRKRQFDTGTQEVIFKFAL
ncbi:hypothetical protein FA13DRAFT_1711163 [Coprinellus micaceus]|uniref:Uncharacterized protein n=1 Tax=Coprinellus micaceus TaxID=71717 RepID=A0A4Y7T636_COPMI|nr:hypothetical protein FA13DRAFT_1711163 [Coprinellus micaceus]